MGPQGINLGNRDMYQNIESRYFGVVGSLLLLLLFLLCAFTVFISFLDLLEQSHNLDNLNNRNLLYHSF